MSAAASMALVLVVLGLSLPLVPRLILGLRLTLVLRLILGLRLTLVLTLTLSLVARLALALGFPLPPALPLRRALALVALRSLRDLASLIERPPLLGFPLPLRRHLFLLALSHLILARARATLLTQLPLVLALEDGALLTHAVIETTLLGPLTLDRRAGESPIASPLEFDSLRPRSGNSRAIHLDGAALDRNIPQMGRRARIHDLISRNITARGALDDLGTETALRRQRVVHFVAGHISRPRKERHVAAWGQQARANPRRAERAHR